MTTKAALIRGEVLAAWVYLGISHDVFPVRADRLVYDVLTDDFAPYKVYDRVMDLLIFYN
jgi:hypothetical protein